MIRGRHCVEDWTELKGNTPAETARDR